MAAMVKGHLPTDLIWHILSRFPFKTLFRFKCVSKSWHDLISDKYFMSSRQGKHLQVFSKASFQKDTKKYVLQLSTYASDDGPLHDECKFEVDESGQMLSSYGGSLLCYVTGHSVSICNPSTHQMFTLPKGSHCEDGYYNGMVGFAYLPLEDEYKIVRLFYKHWNTKNRLNDFEIGCEILTLRDDVSCSSWRVVQDEYCPDLVGGYYPVTVNGAVHWLVYFECLEYFDELDEDEVIVSFDFKDEKFKMVLAPHDGLRFGICSLALAELKGFLVLASKSPQSEIEFWVLKDYDNHLWVKEYKIDASGMERFDPDFFAVLPIDVQDGEILTVTDLERLDYYNIETKRNFDLHGMHLLKFLAKISTKYEQLYIKGADIPVAITGFNQICTERQCGEGQEQDIAVC
ncbi:hypothetical protein RJ640_006712 [Escallonia rubra]|uniref:F-box domain-containing protein n=1 Tax=Escallonia rubra TaxID=112253 RepID=A0AA88R3Q3_9ASTE|nr:hypothetical protein RJ640_006712 [Escallonia rubra]